MSHISIAAPAICHSASPEHPHLHRSSISSTRSFMVSPASDQQSSGMPHISIAAPATWPQCLFSLGPSARRSRFSQSNVGSRREALAVPVTMPLQSCPRSHIVMHRAASLSMAANARTTGNVALASNRGRLLCPHFRPRCHLTFTWTPMQNSRGPSDLSPVAGFLVATIVISQLQAIDLKPLSKLHRSRKPSPFCNSPKLLPIACGDFAISTLASANGSLSGVDMYCCSGCGFAQYLAIWNHCAWQNVATLWS